ncbi:hypothetical protein N566_16980 [Streptomycetaceae bacterium MP113-05]|nr:hypothetical protein N566_16980 [Streptomycetaceae bacterium MP113-05]
MRTDTEEAGVRGDFAVALEEAEAVAALSPSSHNCQPWGLARLVGDARAKAEAYLDMPPAGAGLQEDDFEYLVLALDRSRELSALRAHTLEMYLSCGSYGRMLLRALATLGWAEAASRTAVAGEPPSLGSDWPADWTPLCVTAVRRTEAHAEELPLLRDLATRRRTNRGPYREDALQESVLDGLVHHTVENGVTVRHLTTSGELRRFAAFVARHAGRDFRNGPAWRETHSYLRFNDAQVEASGDGFTLAHLFGPMSGMRRLAFRIMLSPAVMRTLCMVGFHRVLALGLAGTVRHSPALVAMSFDKETPDLSDALRGGARMADYWLAATEAGLGLHPVSVVLQHDDLRRTMQAELGLHGRTFFLSRLGRPRAEAEPSPRRGGTPQFRTV